MGGSMKINIEIECEVDGSNPTEEEVETCILKRISQVIMSEEVSPDNDKWALIIESIDVKLN
jgi:hypothetical protein